ncbi:hypothetical protein [Haemophilus haemolyticus]|uniref:hypothetical protein n=1 Tax=Haemophilus haemolyticus TaxID=726 RepID=UPI000E56EB77|nr:hypothetical protein [Haemophilus haemolyticus]
MANIKQEIRAWLENPENDSCLKRAELIRYIMRDCIYDFVKHERPEGLGLDGKNGPERQDLAKIVDIAENYYHKTLEDVLTIKMP